MNPRPVIRTQADLERAWQCLPAPAGRDHHPHDRPSIWMMLIDVEDRPLPQLIEVDDCDQPPGAEGARAFALFADQLLGDLAPGGRWALLLSRPGSSAVTAIDLAWARSMVDAFRSHGVPTDVMHLGTDHGIVPLPLDVLARSA